MTGADVRRPAVGGPGLLGILRRRWRLALLVVLVCAGVGAWATMLTTPRYRSTVKMVLVGDAAGDRAGGSSSGVSPVQQVKSFEELLAGATLAARVIDRLDLDLPVEQVLGRITAAAVPDTVVLVVDVEDADPARAQAIARAVGIEFPRLLDEQADGVVGDQRLRVFEPAGLPAAPVWPNTRLIAALAVTLGAVAGLLAAALAEGVTSPPPRRRPVVAPAPAQPRSRQPGVFVVSLDFELAWGSWSRGQFDDRVFAQGATLARRLDAVAREQRMPFTWAIVGALYDLTIEELQDAPAAASVGTLRPHLGPFSEPLPTVGRVLERPESWLARDVVSDLSASSAHHELATHTYFHATPDTPAGLAADLAASRQSLPGSAGFSLGTIVFPRDLVRHRAALVDAGVTQYRGPGEAWYYRRGRHATRRERIGHMAAQLLGTPARLAHVHPGEATELTTSAALTIRHGLRRRIPPAALRRRFLTPLTNAVSAGGIYHLWTHPWNLAIPGSDAFDVFAHVCAEAADLRDRGDLEILTMEQVCERDRV